jgi:transcriptional regulator with XRE-family HTH domain
MATSSSQSFGDLLRRYRLAAGLTQEELAARAGSSVRRLSDLERGARRDPRRETVRLIAEAFQLSEAGWARLEAAARHRGISAARAQGGSLSPEKSFVSREHVYYFSLAHPDFFQEKL